MIKKPGSSLPARHRCSLRFRRRWHGPSCITGPTSSAASSRRAATGLKSFLKTTDDVLILACSGTGAMEAAVVNVLSPGERCWRWWPATSASAGPRSARPTAWTCACSRRPGARRCTAGASGGRARPGAADPSGLRPALRVLDRRRPRRRGAGARSRGERPDTLLVVDAISGAGAMQLETAAWGVDMVVRGEPEGAGPAAGPGLRLGERHAPGSASRRRARPRFYFDLRRERKAQAGGETAFTPAISHVVALQAALDFVAAVGGVDALVENAGTLAAMTRAAAAALGLPLVAPRRLRRRADRALPARGHRVQRPSSRA